VSPDSDTRRAVAALAACRPLADRLAASPDGIDTPLTAADLDLLHGYEEVLTAYSGYEHELRLDALRSAAGLRPSDAGLLRGALDQHYGSNPVLARARIARLERWLTRAGEPASEPEEDKKT